MTHSKHPPRFSYWAVSPINYTCSLSGLAKLLKILFLIKIQFIDCSKSPIYINL